MMQKDELYSIPVGIWEEQENATCPLVAGGCKLTYNSYASCCLARQVRAKKPSSQCGICERGQLIKAGQKATPPEGMEIIEAYKWIEQPIIQPTEKDWNSQYKRKTIKDLTD